ncbi:DUF4183 domain-containing protein [Bacillus sp. MCCB 382]|uniref:DUF4183 domain-containing protein n=1 Tax=Bacillus sp. MCCB 382 TaxID=2860197 RepID=UPI001C576E21|nr:DUF4183 domain-containing protein [Bacillus sp. MCCB 382]
MRKKSRAQRYVNQGIRCIPEFPPKSCHTIYPPVPIPQTPGILKTTTFQYVAYSDGAKRNFTNQDRSEEYSTSGILCPQQVSYMNLFVNAMLQPPSLYKVREGLLTLNSADLPAAGVPVILQYILIHRE